MTATVTDRLRRDLAREEAWLDGDWDSRSARGIATMERHAAKRDELRSLLGLPPYRRKTIGELMRPDISYHDANGRPLIGPCHVTGCPYQSLPGGESDHDRHR